MFFPLHFLGVNNMYWESERGEFLHPWRKGESHRNRPLRGRSKNWRESSDPDPFFTRVDNSTVQ